MRSSFLLFLLFGILAIGIAQSDIVNISTQSADLPNGWRASYSIESGKLNVRASVACDNFKRQTNGAISAIKINSCIIHPFPITTFSGDATAFVSLWEASACQRDLGCCGTTCLKQMSRAFTSVPNARIGGCSDGMMSINYEGILDSVYSRCGPPPPNGLISLSVVEAMPTNAMRIPMHGRWFYTTSPASDSLRVGVDRLVLSNTAQGKTASPLDRNDIFFTSDIPLKLFRQSDAKLGVLINAALSSIDGTSLVYTGTVRLYAGSSSEEGTVTIVCEVGEGRKSWRVVQVNISIAGISLTNVKDATFAPGPGGFLANSRRTVDLDGGDEFYMVLVTENPVEMQVKESEPVILSITRPMPLAVPKRRELETVPEVQVSTFDRVKILEDSNTPMLRRAMVTLISKVKSERPYSVQMVKGGKGDEHHFAWFEQVSASCNGVECEQRWDAVTAYVPVDEAETLMGMYNVQFNLRECSPADETAVAEGRCPVSPYHSLKTQVRLSTSYEMPEDSLMFENHMHVSGQRLVTGNKVTHGQPITGTACLVDNLTGELGDAVDMAINRIAMVVVCEDNSHMTFDMLVDGLPFDDEMAKAINAHVLVEPVPRGCMQYEFNAVLVPGCPDMGVQIEYEVQSHVHGLGKRDLHVTVQTTNSSDVLVTVSENGNVGAVNVSLNGTNNLQEAISFDWDDDSDSPTAAATTVPLFHSPTAKHSGGHGHHHSGSSHESHHHKKVIVEYGSHGSVISKETIPSSSSEEEGWVAFIIVAAVVLGLLVLVVAACILYPGSCYWNDVSGATIVAGEGNMHTDVAGRDFYEADEMHFHNTPQGNVPVGNVPVGNVPRYQTPTNPNPLGLPGFQTQEEAPQVTLTSAKKDENDMFLVDLSV